VTFNCVFFQVMQEELALKGPEGSINVVDADTGQEYSVQLKDVVTLDPKDDSTDPKDDSNVGDDTPSDLGGEADVSGESPQASASAPPAVSNFHNSYLFIFYLFFIYFNYYVQI